ncbi:MAG: methionine--tRNA ligase [Acidobacteria bacterium]|nr:methionine--tRNA ligase [Acidobacteriota bacterium]
MDKRKFYITTPIYYVNALPHVGHTYTTIVCDAVARFHRMLGNDTWFLTGTDEHGQKVERSAAAAGKAPRALTDEVAGAYRALWDRMGIRYDDFIRTTEDRHKRGVQELFRRLRDKGFIYKGRYSGQYCTFDELYVDAAGPGAPCPECGRPTEAVSEENYYFKLSAMEERLLRHYNEHPEFIRPETRRNEVMAFVRGGLRDLSVSRTSVKWGIPVPDDEAHVIYVWLDALANYATAVGFGSPDKKDLERYERYWPADVHMVGKEIVRFHCVYWPAFLMAAELPLPRSIIAHGWLLFEEGKMSKSRGNIVRTETVLDVLGADALRYFLMREVVFGQDGAFSLDALAARFNADLANDYGNLSSRTLAMITRYFRAEVPYPSGRAARTPADKAIADAATQTIASYRTLFEDYQFSRALEAAWSLIGAVNKYLVENEPWAAAEKPDEESRSRLATILYTAAETLRIVTALVHPVMPDSTARIWAQLGLGTITKVRLDQLKWGQLKHATKLGKVEPVFPRTDKAVLERMQQLEAARTAPAGEKETARKEAPATTPAAPPAAASPTPAATSPASASDGRISIDDFAKVEMRVGLVKVAEKVKGADKLLRLEVDIGAEVRQVVAGIAEAYDPATLVGRKVVLVVNLQPRKLRGLESNGMIVAASVGDKGTPVLAGFLEDVPVGARLK